MPNPSLIQEPLRATHAFGIPASGFLAVLVLLSAIPAAASPQTIRIEAEDYVHSHNVGGGQIMLGACNHGASGGLAIEGLDWNGDYVEYLLTLQQEFCFVDSLRSAGRVGHVREFVMEFFREDEPGFSVADTLVSPPGGGYG